LSGYQFIFFVPYFKNNLLLLLPLRSFFAFL